MESKALSILKELFTDIEENNKKNVELIDKVKFMLTVFDINLSDADDEENVDKDNALFNGNNELFNGNTESNALFNVKDGDLSSGTNFTPMATGFSTFNPYNASKGLEVEEEDDTDYTRTEKIPSDYPVSEIEGDEAIHVLHIYDAKNNKVELDTEDLDIILDSIDNTYVKRDVKTKLTQVVDGIKNLYSNRKTGFYKQVVRVLDYQIQLRYNRINPTEDDNVKNTSNTKNSNDQGQWSGLFDQHEDFYNRYA